MKRDERSGKMPVVRANFGFFLLLSLALLFDRSGLAVGCICAALLHELGHLLAMAVCGVSVTAVCLCPLGVRIERAEPTSLNRELLINLSGPMVNLLLALVLYRAEKFPFSAVNCVLGLFELCPLPSLDGGQALFCLMQRYFCLRTAQKFCTVVQGITCWRCWRLACCCCTGRKTLLCCCCPLCWRWVCWWTEEKATGRSRYGFLPVAFC